MRGDRTFAYDLVMRLGAVSGRVVLLLRSTEAKPNSLLSVRIHSPTLVAASAVLERGSQRVVVVGFWDIVRQGIYLVGEIS